MASGLRAICPGCSTRLKVPLDRWNSRARCPRCRQRFLPCEHPVSNDDETANSLEMPESSFSMGLPLPSTATLLNTGSFGRFEIRELLGEGGSGAVYRAYDPLTDREIALKVPRAVLLDQSSVNRFLRESRTAGSLEHPGIVQILEAGREGNSLYIASKLVVGKSLSAIIKQRRFSFKEAARIVSLVADALVHAHSHGVVHRDIKPHNILMENGSKPRLTDFGLAKRASIDETITLDDALIGTPAYMSPEHIAGEKIGPESDQYSLGVVLYELLTARRPFEGPAHVVLAKRLQQEPPTLASIDASIPAELQLICQKAMARLPRDRYPSIEQFRDDLENWLAGRPTQFTKKRRFDHVRLWPGTILASISAGVLLMLVLFFAAIYSSTRLPHPLAKQPLAAESVDPANALAKENPAKGEVNSGDHIQRFDNIKPPPVDSEKDKTTPAQTDVEAPKNDSPLPANPDDVERDVDRDPLQSNLQAPAAVPASSVEENDFIPAEGLDSPTLQWAFPPWIERPEAKPAIQAVLDRRDSLPKVNSSEIWEYAVGKSVQSPLPASGSEFVLEATLLDIRQAGNNAYLYVKALETEIKRIDNGDGLTAKGDWVNTVLPVFLIRLPCPDVTQVFPDFVPGEPIQAICKQNPRTHAGSRIRDIPHSLSDVGYLSLTDDNRITRIYLGLSASAVGKPEDPRTWYSAKDGSSRQLESEDMAKETVSSWVRNPNRGIKDPLIINARIKRFFGDRVIYFEMPYIDHTKTFVAGILDKEMPLDNLSNFVANERVILRLQPYRASDPHTSVYNRATQSILWRLCQEPSDDSLFLPLNLYRITGFNYLVVRVSRNMEDPATRDVLIDTAFPAGSILSIQSRDNPNHLFDAHAPITFSEDHIDSFAFAPLHVVGNEIETTAILIGILHRDQTTYLICELKTPGLAVNTLIVASNDPSLFDNISDYRDRLSCETGDEVAIKVRGLGSDEKSRLLSSQGQLLRYFGDVFNEFATPMVGFSSIQKLGKPNSLVDANGKRTGEFDSEPMRTDFGRLFVDRPPNGDRVTFRGHIKTSQNIGSRSGLLVEPESTVGSLLASKSATVVVEWADPIRGMSGLQVGADVYFSGNLWTEENGRIVLRNAAWSPMPNP